jgi:hypothetical protein
MCHHTLVRADELNVIDRANGQPYVAARSPA